MSDGASADLEVSHTLSGAKLYNCMSLQSIKGKQETLLYFMSCLTYSCMMCMSHFWIPDRLIEKTPINIQNGFWGTWNLKVWKETCTCTHSEVSCLTLVFLMLILKYCMVFSFDASNPLQQSFLFEFRRTSSTRIPISVG